MVRGIRKKCKKCDSLMYTFYIFRKNPLPRYHKLGWICRVCCNIVFSQEAEKEIESFNKINPLLKTHIAFSEAEGEVRT